MSSTELPGIQAAAAAVAPTVSAVRVAEGEKLRSVTLAGLTLTVRSRPAEAEGRSPPSSSTAWAAPPRTGRP